MSTARKVIAKTKPSRAAVQGDASRHAHSSGTRATSASGPRSSGGYERARSTPLTAARTNVAPAWLEWLIFPHQVNYHIEHHLYASVPHYNLPALRDWLRTQREERGGATERNRRLDSDAAAVQIMTVWVSKGLQYPVVYLPFAFNRNVQEREMVLFHDGDTRCLYIGGKDSRDFDTVAASVRKTGRAVVVHEGARTLGFGAELAARIQEELFYDLEAPVLRATGFDTPYPPARLEKLWLPGVDRVIDSVEKAMQS